MPHRVDAEVLHDDPLDAHQLRDYFPDSHTDLAIGLYGKASTDNCLQLR